MFSGVCRIPVCNTASKPACDEVCTSSSSLQQVASRASCHGRCLYEATKGIIGPEGVSNKNVVLVPKLSCITSVVADRPPKWFRMF